MFFFRNSAKLNVDFLVMSLTTLIAWGAGSNCYAKGDVTPRDISAERLDGVAIKPVPGQAWTCFTTSTFDQNVWDKNRYMGQSPDNHVAGMQINRNLIGQNRGLMYWSAKLKPLMANKSNFSSTKIALFVNNNPLLYGSNDNVNQLELIQYSWAQRARCHQALESGHTIATGALGFFWVVADQFKSKDHDGLIGPDLQKMGLLVLAPVMLDDFRATSSTRRYYNSAVLGTSLMSTRNKNILDALGSVNSLNPDNDSLNNCYLYKPISFKLKTSDVAGIEDLQAKVRTGIEAYNKWCDAVVEARVKVATVQANYKTIKDGFMRERAVRWKQYVSLINNNGFSQQAKSKTVFNRFISLPTTLSKNIFGDGASGYDLTGSAQIAGADAVILPTIVGDFSLASSDSNIATEAYKLKINLALLKKAVEGAPKGKNRTNDFEELNKIQLDSNFQVVEKFWYSSKMLFARIESLNTQKYIILDIDSGQAYLTTVSISQIKESGAQSEDSGSYRPTTP